ncbi:Rhodanese-like domain-containing protein [Scenedesmus sp. NREL 46B-D3]|nr:Rhodanese-like domain-containing protein [Scenedesmus sp. NREL 46B-D3]
MPRFTQAQQARQRSGPSGLHVAGQSPTSPKGWQTMRLALIQGNVKMVSPQEVQFAADRGALLVDVRPQADYDAGHVPGAYNVPFYQPITGWSPLKVARRVGYAMFGVLKGTEVNPSFPQGDASPGARPEGLLGGVLEPDDNYRKGWQTRSLIAAYDLMQEGMSNSITVMKGGYTEWVNGGRDFEVIEEVTEEELVREDVPQR